MQLFSLFAVILVILGAICSTAFADYHKKPLKIKHVWKKHSYGKGYGKGGYGGGKKMVGYSKRYQHMKHGHGKHY